jgi:hypothetical protein
MNWSGLQAIELIARAASLSCGTLSHSSCGKEPVVLPPNSSSQNEDIPVWLDSFVIDYG